MTGKELRQHMLPKTAPLPEKLKMFKEVLLPRHPPLFHEWFLRTFPDPTSWWVTGIGLAQEYLLCVFSLNVVDSTDKD